MPFKVNIVDELPLSGFDLGEIIFIDGETDKRSTPALPAKYYMAFVELSVLFDQITIAKTNKSTGRYVLPDGNYIEFDGKRGTVRAVFAPLDKTIEIQTVLNDLRATMTDALVALREGSDEHDSMITQFREILSETH